MNILLLQQEKCSIEAGFVWSDLLNNLERISGYSELLKCGLTAPEDVQAFVEKIYGETHRLISLVKDIISLSHLDEGGKDLRFACVNLMETAENVVENLKGLAASHDVTLSLNGEHAHVNAVPELIQTMTYNLCDNAIKYNHPGGSVSVTIGELAFSVKDNGIGIPKEHLDRIFERFYRVDKSYSKEVGGTRLGLSIVKHAAFVHGTDISVDSTVGEGTTITVTFPKETAETE